QRRAHFSNHTAYPETDKRPHSSSQHSAPNSWHRTLSSRHTDCTYIAPPRHRCHLSVLCPLWNVCRFSATNGWGNSSPLVREIAARFESAADGHSSHRSIRTYLASRHFASGRRRFEQLRLD